jgi:hypothetical protein
MLTAGLYSAARVESNGESDLTFGHEQHVSWRQKSDSQIEYGVIFLTGVLGAIVNEALD